MCRIVNQFHASQSAQAGDIAIIVVLAIGATAVITIPRLHAVHYTNNIAFSSGGGQADIQVLNFKENTGFSIVFHAYTSNITGILFSVQAPDGLFLIHNVNVTTYSYEFTASQNGPYALIFSSPRPSAGVDVAANMTAYEPLIYWYQPSGCNQQVSLQQIPSVPTEVCST